MRAGNEATFAAVGDRKSVNAPAFPGLQGKKCAAVAVWMGVIENLLIEVGVPCVDEIGCMRQERLHFS